MPATGYSGKSLTQKLGVRCGDVILAIDPPAQYPALMAPLPDGARIATEATAPAIVHAFVAESAALNALAARLVTLPAPGGALWISWPKKRSPLFIDLTEDGVRAAILPEGWVDVKVCAVDDDWSGLKFLRRRGTR